MSVNVPCSTAVGQLSLTEQSFLRSKRGGWMAGLVCEDCHDKVPQLGGFVHRNVLSHSSGGQKYEVEVSAGLVPPADWEDLFWPLSLACRGPSSLCVPSDRLPSVCTPASTYPVFIGTQACGSRAQPNGLTLT